MQTGTTAVQAAVEAGRVDVLKALLARGPPATALGGAVLAAAAHGRAGDVIDLLVRAGANVKEHDASGATPLHRASECGHVDVIRQLVELGADANAQDKLLRTPLHVATAAGAAKCVLALLRAGADLTVADDLGRTVGDVSDAMMRSGGAAAGVKVDDATLREIYEMFKHELEQAHAAVAAEAAEGAGRTAAGGDSMHSILSGLAAEDELPAPPLSPPVTDLESLVALLLAKFRACVQAGLLPSYEDIYKALDSAGDGRCSPGDLATVRCATAHSCGLSGGPLVFGQEKGKARVAVKPPRTVSQSRQFVCERGDATGVSCPSPSPPLPDLRGAGLRRDGRSRARPPVARAGEAHHRHA
jgi:hypothetical protein